MTIITVIWMVFLVGYVANIVQVIQGFAALPAIGEVSGYLFIKAVAIFMGPVGSVLGFVDMF